MRLDSRRRSEEGEIGQVTYSVAQKDLICPKGCDAQGAIVGRTKLCSRGYRRTFPGCRDGAVKDAATFEAALRESKVIAGDIRVIDDGVIPVSGVISLVA